MKLKKIKLSGFKSFVDPTNIQLQSNLTGVVGPNGCGKSNIIDALKWVMGEISAKQLRGSSMSDVIFNGSSARKPVGKAMVELVFDNSLGKFGGEYAKYGEISIRREVDRATGLSDYFLNNANCRRKDITGIFLGTGLGSNSYAVIEQGMITRFIDAKPDELRVFIEEAAGISRYKERRKETENRIKHTKENLSRINDIVEEVDKQLKHLKSQARAAERYQKLKQEERLTKAELHTLNWRTINSNLKNQDNEIKEKETRLENSTTEVNVLNGKIAAFREELSGDTDKFNEIQESYYRLGANVARLEQQIKHTEERREQLTKDLDQVKQVWQELTNNQTTDQVKIEEYLAEKVKVEADVLKAKEELTKAQAELSETERQEQLWQKAWDDFNTNSSKVLQLLEVERTRISHLEERIKEDEQNLEKFVGELKDQDFSALNTEIEKLHGDFKGLADTWEILQEKITAKQQDIAEAREKSNELANTLDQERNKLQALIGRKASLEALQQAALGKNDEGLVDWLSQHGLSQKSRLVHMLDVTAGWEMAVEAVLGSYLEAVCVDGIIEVIPAVKNLNSGNLSLFDRTIYSKEVEPRLNLPTLAGKINTKEAIGGLLSGVYVAENLTDALDIQAKLNHDESVITKDGVWLGTGWLRVAYDKASPKAGVLQRERELHELNESIADEENNCRLQEKNLKEQQIVVLNLEEEHQKLQQELHLLMSEYSDVQSQVAAKKTYLKHLAERSQELEEEVAARKNNLKILREQLSSSLENREEALKQKETHDAKQQEIMQSRKKVAEDLLAVREAHARAEQGISSFTLRVELLQTKVDHLTQSLDRDSKRLSGLKEQQADVEKALAEVDLPLPDLSLELESGLAKRLVVEGELVTAKQKISNLEQNLRDLEEQYAKCRKVSEDIRVLLEQARAERQGLQVRSSTYQEQVRELELELDELHTSIPEDAEIVVWEEKLARLSSRIDRLGLINLAAIEEFEKLQERKDYLDTQSQDLIDALNALEEAIRKIDLDTKERFKSAYNRINERFQELFPKIFNGGKGYLEQTTNNLLETGVEIMAQPPGKRNSNIHLLSGGEKALTAIALIFSIFHLNPAPFCILDEVDAPLDDANIIRFCNLVKEMAQAIQFVFITHNKLTMEISDCLVGVTMQEPGVSRLVTVDVDEAVSLAGRK